MNGQKDGQKDGHMGDETPSPQETIERPSQELAKGMGM
jgi:hypothetical protein